MKILLVDDEMVVIHGLKAMIHKAKIPFDIILEATSGNKAVQIAEEQKPEIILMDIKIPGIDGINAAKMIKKISPHSKIIFLTAYARFDYAQAALQSKASAYLIKPVNPEELKLTILECIEDIYPYLNASQVNPVIRDAVTYILENINKPITLESLAERVQLSPSYFSTLFRKERGQTFSDFLISARMEKAKTLLRENALLTIFQISEQVGYDDSNYFSRIFKQKVGIPPNNYRKKVNTKVLERI